MLVLQVYWILIDAYYAEPVYELVRQASTVQDFYYSVTVRLLEANSMFAN